MPTSKEIGDKIRALRKEKGMTMADLAKAADVGEPAIANYESGLRVPRDDIKKKIAGALDVRVGTLFFEE